MLVRDQLIVVCPLICFSNLTGAFPRALYFALSLNHAANTRIQAPLCPSRILLCDSIAVCAIYVAYTPQFIVITRCWVRNPREIDMICVIHFKRPVNADLTVRYSSLILISDSILRTRSLIPNADRPFLAPITGSNARVRHIPRSPLQALCGSHSPHPAPPPSRLLARACLLRVSCARTTLAAIADDGRAAV